ncbi:hypothetical protein BJ170DRAFT_679200 [Xylariales sp. AK1849]|nr:hypothetical protein BJ170DRAFT_679200 [Xylariales sp. AK1849]
MAQHETTGWSSLPADAGVAHQQASIQPLEDQQWKYHDVSPISVGNTIETTGHYQPSSGDGTIPEQDITSTAHVKGPPEMKWWPWGKTAEQKVHKNLSNQFNGKRGWNGHFFQKPQRPDLEHQDHAVLSEADYGGALKKDKDGKFEYRNQFGQKSSKYSDVAVYLSPTNYTPRRLLVQSTDYVLQNQAASGDWRRRKLSGDVPSALTLAEWSLRPFQKKGWWRKIDGSLRLLLVSVPLQLCLAFPGSDSWNDEDAMGTYTDFPGYHWQWPKHAINPLDRKPVNDNALHGLQPPSSRQRMIRPRQLVVQQPDGSWKVDAAAPRNLKYVFISYADKAFGTEGGRRLIQDMAATVTREAGCKAYWLDFRCRAPQPGDLLDSDVYRMCDVIRGCSRVVVMLPDTRVESKKNWGARMWTMPEALLAPGDLIFFCTPDGDGHKTDSLTLIEMTSEVWDDPVGSEEDGGSTRLLAEHYSGELTLSRLELFAAALDALGYRSEHNYTFFTVNDITYALMGLLHYRIKRDNTDSAFQSLAQLSLGNDTDQIIERMVSLHPRPGLGSFNPFRSLAREDLFHTHLWDIQPTCQVVGVAHENNTVLLDSCRAMHIRWKGFPRMVVARDFGFRKLLATVLVTAGTWWFLQGVSLAIYYAPFYSTQTDSKLIHILEWMVAGYAFVAVLLSIFGPYSVRRLYGGQVLQSTSNLVAFEGVMPIAKLERLVFGNNNSRLSYEASSTPYGEEYRNPDLRVGVEPDWVSDQRPEPEKIMLPPGHKLFTLVDTGELSVSIFSAERPPTVALLCGREGGMLRAVLCSWQFENDCLYKETVIRMPSSVWDAATPKGWLKVCLGTLNQEREAERAYKLEQTMAEKK